MYCQEGFDAVCSLHPEHFEAHDLTCILLGLNEARPVRCDPCGLPDVKSLTPANGTPGSTGDCVDFVNSGLTET